MPIATYIFKFIIIFAAYFITAKIGLSLDAVSGFATLVWAPTGISLAALVIFGIKFWPTIFLAAFSVNLTTGASPLVALGMGVGNSLEALIGAFFLKRFIKVETFLDQIRDVFILVLFAAFISTAVSASIGVASLYLGGVVGTSELLHTWTSWWIGDMLGDLIVFPLIVTWRNFSFPSLNPKVTLELLAFLLAITFANLVIFLGLFNDKIFFLAREYFIFPILLWVALRFDKRIVTLTIALTALIAIIGTIQGISPFATAQGFLSDNLLNLQTFIAVVSTMILSLSVVVSEKRRAQQSLELINANLETRVKEQTQTLKEALNQSIQAENESKSRTGELERMNKLMVGRELKMVELKKEVEKLKKLIGNSNGQ